MDAPFADFRRCQTANCGSRTGRYAHPCAHAALVLPARHGSGRFLLWRPKEIGERKVRPECRNPSLRSSGFGPARSRRDIVSRMRVARAYPVPYRDVVMPRERMDARSGCATPFGALSQSLAVATLGHPWPSRHLRILRGTTLAPYGAQQSPFGRAG
jgi:hypothetical protein